MNRHQYWSQRTNTGFASLDKKPHPKLPKIKRFFHDLKEIFMFCFVSGLILGIIILATLLLDDLNLASGTIIVLVLALVVYLWYKTGTN